MDVPHIYVFLGGLVVMTLGSEFLLRGASRIAALLGIRPIIIGLTVVSIGTSLPELAVGITAASEDKGSLAIANIAGTNILNILFILGLSTAIRPLKLYMNTIKFDVRVMIFTSILLFFMSLNGILGFWEGFTLLLISFVYFFYVIKNSKKEEFAVQKEYAEEYSPNVLLNERGTKVWVYNSILLLGGMGLTVVGADLLVSGAVSIAQDLGVSDAVIGLTIVAVGTSAPELVTTMVATYRNDRDVAVGNLIGSSITNILVILGITLMAVPNGVDVNSEVLWVDIPLAALVAIVCWPVFKSDSMISRREGIGFVLAYLIYMAVIIVFRT